MASHHVIGLPNDPVNLYCGELLLIVPLMLAGAAGHPFRA